MKLTLVHPAIGHRAGERYIRSWQMESLPIATLKGLTPDDVEVRFHDDRMEPIPFDEPTDAVAIPVETYTAARAYQIASEYRRRRIPVVMGGFHATLLPQEVSCYADAVVTGEAEAVWHEVVDDLRHGTLKRRYHGEQRPLSDIRVDRRVFGAKRYLPLGLIETGRGCRFPCEFCAIQSFFSRTYRARPVEEVIAEIAALRDTRKLFFFVDDNFAGDMKAGMRLLPELARLKVRWITQMSINAAHDEGFLQAMREAGCQGVLIGFESLDPENLKLMNKRFNTMRSGYSGALANLRKHRLFVYGTFVFGYEHDNGSSFAEAVDFASEEGMYIAAFNHLTPFPGTPLYQSLQEQGRLLYDAWWLDERYRYNQIPFRPAHMTPERIQRGCVEARTRFYNWSNIWKRGLDPVNRSNPLMWLQYYSINAMFRGEVSQRDDYPLGDENWRGSLLKVREVSPDL